MRTNPPSFLLGSLAIALSLAGCAFHAEPTPDAAAQAIESCLLRAGAGDEICDTAIDHGGGAEIPSSAMTYDEALLSPHQAGCVSLYEACLTASVGVDVDQRCHRDRRECLRADNALDSAGSCMQVIGCQDVLKQALAEGIDSASAYRVCMTTKR